ncbi:hypothetical protein BSKO_10490 [Bryopsis sp. KO-2023]|nr:hypothetical protein BSKO_10490 [Bryopsis sp. KO-2023]
MVQEELVAWDLPSSIVSRIFRSLSRRQVARAACVCSSWKRTASITKATAFLSRAVSKKEQQNRLGGSGKKKGKLTSKPSCENLELIGEVFKKERALKPKQEKAAPLDVNENLELIGDSGKEKPAQPKPEKAKNPDVKRIAVFKDTEFRQIHCMVRWKADLVVVAGVVVPFDGFLEVWSLADRIVIKQLVGDLFGESCMAVRDNTLVCSGARGTLKVWDLASGARKMTLRGHNRPVNAVIDLGSFWATGSDDSTIRIWDTENTCCKAMAHANYAVTSLAANSDNTVIVSGSDHKQMQVWCAESMVCFYTLDVPDGVLSMASGCNMLLTGSRKGLQMWDFTQDVPAIFRKAGGGMEHITHVCVEGKTVVTASPQSVKVWDVDQCKRVRKVEFMGGVAGALLWGKVMMVGTILANAPLMFCDLI